MTSLHTKTDNSNLLQKLFFYSVGGNNKKLSAQLIIFCFNLNFYKKKQLKVGDILLKTFVLFSIKNNFQGQFKKACFIKFIV